MKLRNLFRRLKSVQLDDERARRSVDNVDAGAAARAQHKTGDPGVMGAGGAPPNYVKADEGRPKH